MSHYAQFVVELTILALAIFLGIEVISKVPTLLHTPLMSGTNAIHGIIIVGALLVAGMADPDLLTGWVGFIAMILASANVVGGFVVTDRMLEMFKRREPPKEKDEGSSDDYPARSPRSRCGAGGHSASSTGPESTVPRAGPGAREARL